MALRRDSAQGLLLEGIWVSSPFFLCDMITVFFFACALEERLLTTFLSFFSLLSFDISLASVSAPGTALANYCLISTFSPFDIAINRHPGSVFDSSGELSHPPTSDIDSSHGC